MFLKFWYIYVSRGIPFFSIQMLQWNQIYENKRDIRKTECVRLNCNCSNLTVIKTVNISDEFFILRRCTDISFIQCGID